jgi:hypothetical protein
VRRDIPDGVDFDWASHSRDEEVVDYGFAAGVVGVSRQVVPQSVWDDAVLNSDNRLDPVWAEKNIGQFLTATTDATSSSPSITRSSPFIEWSTAAPRLRPRSRPSPRQRLASSRTCALTKTAGETHPLATDSRSARPCCAARPKSSTVGSLFTATLVQPDFGAYRLRSHQVPLIVTGQVVDTAFVEGFSRRYMLAEPRLDLAGAGPGQGSHPQRAATPSPP